MPYVTEEARVRLNAPSSDCTNAGELNYLLTMRAIDFVSQQPELRYSVINHVVGSFETALGRDPLLVDEEHALARDLRYLMVRAIKIGAVTETDAAGAMRCAQMEFYRRVAAPYEDIAMTKNGDVYR